MRSVLLLLLLLFAAPSEAAPPPNVSGEVEVTVTAPRRLWATEDEVDARHRAEYERLKEKFDPDPPGQTDVGRLRGEMARPIQQRDSPLRDYMRTR
ncbi:hypothetical protein [Roseiterribacter gracilis]|uniref:Uncharacterized protein n=1 Tax=Roseiterribacter gracilis TaxID=2812848 RepID=A0A8S8X9Q0_9PROT|nr:hypothetical protein TMPK1_24200 [Rhodospirillales bacterium TMPK1]